MMNKKTVFLLTIAASLAAGLSAATQWVAHLLRYDPALGRPLCELGGLPLYAPKFLQWWQTFGDQAPREFDQAFWALLLLPLAAIGALALIYRKQKTSTAHGSASWADAKAIERTGLLGGKGIVLGLTDDGSGRYLRHDGPEHVIAMAPTRSGKGVGIIIPTLLSWPHSVLITDIKGENWGLTAGYRKEKLGNKVLKFEPTATDRSSVRFNPLEEIRVRSEHEVGDVQAITDMLVDPQGSGELDHWAKTSNALLLGVILHLLYSRGTANLSGVAAFLSDPAKPVDDALQEMMTATHDESGLFQRIYNVDSRTHPIVAQTAREMINKAEAEKASVISTALACLGLYRDPAIAYNTSASEFKISDLMNQAEPVSLYLVIPPKDMGRTKPLIRLLLNQVIKGLTGTMEYADGKAVQTYKHRLLLLLDEFPAFGRLDSLEAALAFIAGYGMKSLLIAQSLNQLYKTYTRENSIIDNCHIRVAFTPNEPVTAEYLANMLGNKTEIIESESYQGFRIGSRITTSTSQIARQLLTPAEVMLLPADEELLFVAGHAPLKARKIFYFKDKNFTGRLLEAPPRSDVIRSVERPKNTADDVCFSAVVDGEVSGDD